MNGEGPSVADPDTGMTRAEMRAACSPETRAFLEAMDRYKSDGDGTVAMVAFKEFLRAQQPSERFRDPAFRAAFNGPVSPELLRRLYPENKAGE